MQNLGKLSEEEAQKSFIHRIMKLETFGQSFFSVTVSRSDMCMYCMFVCVYTCVYVYVCVCIYVYVRAHVCVVNIVSLGCGEYVWYFAIEIHWHGFIAMQ